MSRPDETTPDDEVKRKETANNKNTATERPVAKSLKVKPAAATGGRVEGPAKPLFRSESVVRELRKPPEIAIVVYLNQNHISIEDASL